MLKLEQKINWGVGIRVMSILFKIFVAEIQ